MIDQPEIIQTPAQKTAFVHFLVPRADIQKVMEPGLRELYEVMVAQKVAPIGPWFTHHRSMKPDVFDFEICIPVATVITPQGNVQAGEIRASKVARTNYRGGYEGLGAAWAEFKQWINANQHPQAPDLWECYVKGPETTPNQTQWCTQLNQPLVA